MGLLDKLKPQPRWKHQDAAIRLDALRELDDLAELGALAESDPDVRVRRAAVAKLSDPAVLGRLMHDDQDQDVRERAADRLMGLACRTDDDATALSAVRAISDPKRLSTIARGDASVAVRADALSRIDDERALSSIARHARQEDTAAAALTRLSSHGDIVEVAVSADHRNVALAAFERLAPHADLALLRAIDARAQEKSVSRRARTMIQDVEAAEAARRAALEERTRREQTLCEAVEQIAGLATDVAMGRAELERVSDAWHTLDVADPAMLERFARGVESAEAAIQARQREADEMAEHRRVRAEAIATREALAARVETLDGDDALEQLIPIEEEWRSLTPLVGNGPEADRLAERFALAVAACRKRREMGSLLDETHRKLEALVAEAEGMSFEGHDTSAITRWQGLNREARGLSTTLAEALRPADDLVARLSAVEQVFQAGETARDAAMAKARLDALRQLQRLTERAKHAAAADAITLREGERLLKDITAGIDASAHGLGGAEIDEAVGQLKALRDQVAPRVRELREMDEWRRFANAQRQEQLIAMAEAIVSSLKSDEEAGKTTDLAATARALRELHAKWREVADAPRPTAQRLWDRFRTATDFIRARCEGYFAALRQEREEQQGKRTAIVAESETLATSTDWGKAGARFQELQQEWQALGPVARETGRELAQRFRTACNTFFARRRENLTDLKKTWAENLAKKEALCERVEALATSTDWETSAAEIKRLQAEWKTIGPVRRNKSETVWNRFRAAADRFFERFHNRHEIMLVGKLAEREAMVVQLESFTAMEALPANLGEEVQALRTAWNRSVPIPAPGMKPLADRWHKALGAIVAAAPDAFKNTDLDPSLSLRRMEKLVARVEALLSEMSETAETLSPTEQLAAKLRSAFATNAMGGRASAESKWRTATDTVKEAQSAWQKLAPVDGSEARALESRFRDACRRVNDRARRETHSQPHGPHSSSSRGSTQREAPEPERQTAAV